MPSDRFWWPFQGPPKALTKALTANSTVPEAIRDQGWQPWPLLGGGNRQRIMDAYNTAQSANYAWMYSKSPAVRTVIDVLVRNIGQLDLRLYEEINEAEREPRPDHEAALSLRYPSEEVPGDQFVRELIKDFLIHDNAYALLTEARANQIALNWVPANMVEIRGASLFRAEGYRFRLRDGTFADFPPERVLHWHGENPLDPRMGHSRLETLRNVIAEDAALQQATVELANAGLTEPVWISRPLEAPEWSPEARDRFEEDTYNRMKRRTKLPLVLEEGMEMKGFGVSPREAQMSEIRRWAITQVANVFGVPLGMVGLDGNLKEAQSQFYADTLPPYCEAFTKMLNHRILVRVYDWTDGCFEFNLDEKHMGDDRVKALVSGSGRAVYTTNEARAKLNLRPIDTGDELVTPLNVIVGEKPKPSVDVMPAQDPNKPDQDGSYREQPPKALVKAVDDYAPLPQLHPARKAEHDRQLRNIDECQAVTAKHFNRLARALPERLDRKANGRRDREDWRRWDSQFADEILATLKAVVTREGRLYAFKLNGDFDAGQVQNYLAVMAEESAKAINSKVRQEISDVGLEDAVARFPAHVESTGAGLGTNATSFARKEAARVSPNPERRVKTWVANTNRHAQWTGTTVPLGDDWPAGFAPGTAPGCKCSMTIE